MAAFPSPCIKAVSLGLTGLAYAFKKDAANTAKIFRPLLEHANDPDRFNAEFCLFLMYAVTGKNDQAFERIARAIENKYPLLLLRFGYPLVNAIKDDP